MNKKLIIKIILIIVVIIIGLSSIAINKKDSEELIIEEINEKNFVNIIKEEIDVLEIPKIKVYVTGEVNSPGVIELEEGDRVEDAINLAGGITDFANLKEVNLACKLEDGQKLYIPNKNEKEVEYLSSESGEKILENGNKNSKSKININTSGAEELKKLPGVGDSLAQRIINYREENGKFKKIDDLKSVSGIGDKKYEELKGMICV